MYKTPGPASRPRPFLWEKREEMNIRHATGQDMDALCALYAEGRRFMAAHGNTAQWRGGYPGRALLEEDLRRGQLYVCEQGGAVCAAFVFFCGRRAQLCAHRRRLAVRRAVRRGAPALLTRARKGRGHGLPAVLHAALRKPAHRHAPEQPAHAQPAAQAGVCAVRRHPPGKRQPAPCLSAQVRRAVCLPCARCAIIGG